MSLVRAVIGTLRSVNPEWMRGASIYLVTASGRRETLEMCARCNQPHITRAQQEYLLDEKVDLGRCVCPLFATLPGTPKPR